MTGYEARRTAPIAQIPHRVKCSACGDFGTIVLDGHRRGSVMPEILKSEAPCTCATGDFWRAFFAEWERPVFAKGAQRPVAVVIDPKPKRPMPVQAPQQISGAAQRMLASIDGKP